MLNSPFHSGAASLDPSRVITHPELSSSEPSCIISSTGAHIHVSTSKISLRPLFFSLFCLYLTCVCSLQRVHGSFRGLEVLLLTPSTHVVLPEISLRINKKMHFPSYFQVCYRPISNSDLSCT